MPQIDTPKNPAPQDWHVADIKCALEKKGWSLARLSKKHRYYRSAAATALSRPWPKMESLIAEAIGVPPQTIWPSRYDEHGNSNRFRFGRRPKLTTQQRSLVIQRRQAA
jgi:Ner family transcriptional regulator